MTTPHLSHIPDELISASAGTDFLNWLTATFNNPLVRCQYAALWTGNTGVTLHQEQWANILDHDTTTQPDATTEDN